MKKHIRLFVLLLVSGAFLLAGGTYAAAKQAEAKFRVNMFTSCFIGDKEGWAAGDQGTIYHTTDGGFNWEKQTTNVVDALFSISFVDAKTGWVVGNRGVILRTTDGGKTWSKQTSPT